MAVSARHLNRGMRLLAILALALTVAGTAGCRQAGGERLMRIGLAEPPRTLNVWLASDAASNKVLSQIYQPLYIMAPETLESVPWLAAALPRFNPAENTYTVALRPAQWSDGTPLTAADVAFTAQLIQSFNIPRYAAKWAPVAEIEVPDDQTVVFHLNRPCANFIDGALATPVVPAHQWAPVAEAARRSEKPLAALLNHPVTDPIGSGPFMLAGHDRDTYLHLRRNPRFFASGDTIAGLSLGPHIDELLFKVYGTSDVAVLALKKGDIDMFWWSIQPGYLRDLSRMPDIEVIANRRSALYFMGFNLRRPPFDDPALRRAAAVLIDKSFIVERILQGHGSPMKAMIPAGNRYWHNPAVSSPGADLARPERILAAYRILHEAGYRWQTPPVDAAGQIQKPTPVLLPDGAPMDRVTILTPPADYDPHRAMSGMMIQEWLHDVGIPATARPMSFSALLATVKSRHAFDAFILGYGRLALDPDYLRTFFHSKNAGPGGWNMSGYRNPDFDRLADRSQRENDPQRRRQIVFRMQTILGEDLPYLPLYTPHLIEAVRTDRFQGWVPMLEGIGNRWSFCRLRAVAGDERGGA
jgi:peptide/nickel transport system substrate-binding protein